MPTKRFGARYGRKPKAKFAKVELEQRKRHKSPFSNKLSIKRLASGIWCCRDTKKKFTGKAYTPR